MTASPGPPDVTVIVVSWNTRELTLACLRSVVAEAGRGTLTCDAVLVDNASSDGTLAAVAAECPTVRVIALEKNLGFALAANAGMVSSDSRLILLLNSDAQLPEGSIERLAAILDAGNRVGAVGAALVGADGERQFACGRFLSPVNQFAEIFGVPRLLPTTAFRRSYIADELSADVVEVDWCVGACLMLRRDAIDDVGAFDEQFFMYSEDEDLCMRLRAAGWSVLHAPSVAVRHEGGASAVPVLDRMRKEARVSQNAFIRKHYGATRAVIFRVLMSVARLKPRRPEARVGWGR